MLPEPGMAWPCFSQQPAIARWFYGSKDLRRLDDRAISWLRFLSHKMVVCNSELLKANRKGLYDIVCCNYTVRRKNTYTVFFLGLLSAAGSALTQSGFRLDGNWGIRWFSGRSLGILTDSHLVKQTPWNLCQSNALSDVDCKPVKSSTLKAHTYRDMMRKEQKMERHMKYHEMNVQ